MIKITHSAKQQDPSYCYIAAAFWGKWVLNELLVPLSKHQTKIILPAQTNCNVKFAQNQIYVLQTLFLRDQTADNNDLNKSLDNDNNSNSAQIIYKIGP